MVRTIVIPRHSESAVQVRDLVDIDEFERVTGGWVKPFELERLSSTIWANQAATLGRGGFNARATALSWHYATPGRPLRFVLGDVVLAGPVDDPVVGMDVPSRVFQTLVDPHHFMIQISRKDEEDWQNTFACFDNVFDAAIWCMIIGLTGPSGWDVRVNPEDPNGDHCDHSPFEPVA
ncbi:hypothetical protein [uncultured Salinibacterium sp.]|uniref:hypothetical protein n=1 Tax=uncultured Salinibacterium sp. TaxID=459274 RepID=UPI0030D9F155|tara:strand:- start:122102 stop:122632 length:531 start_codon:yes stop_codon:yes gene_type:complete